jgi:hypothetical protein
MSIIQPPTDNLYKFMAISGLLIFGFFLVWPTLQIFQLSRETIQLQGEMDALDVEVDIISESITNLKKEDALLEKRTADLRKRVQNLATLPKKVLKSKGINIEAESDRLHQDEITIIKKAEELREKNDLLRIKNVELITKRKLLESALAHFRTEVIMLFVGAIVGLLLSTWGFWLWYFRVQRFQDMIIRKQAS